MAWTTRNPESVDGAMVAPCIPVRFASISLLQHRDSVAGVRWDAVERPNGAWVGPTTLAFLDVIDPSTEEVITKIAVGSAADVDRGVAGCQGCVPEPFPHQS